MHDGGPAAAHGFEVSAFVARTEDAGRRERRTRRAAEDRLPSIPQRYDAETLMPEGIRQEAELMEGWCPRFVAVPSASIAETPRGEGRRQPPEALSAAENRA